METVLHIVEQAKHILRHRLEAVEASGGLRLEQYVRYLSMQFHLTRDVQRHFFAIASHSSLAAKPKLREFLVSFGIEEEPHYRIALKDLENLGQKNLSMPLAVQLWWNYFDSVITERPLVRLGATCVLENLGSGGSDVVKRLLKSAPYINDRTSRFITIHLHEELPHGEQVIDILKQAGLDSAQMSDLEEGARTGAILYLRMLDWVLMMDPLTAALEKKERSHVSPLST